MYLAVDEILAELDQAVEQHKDHPLTEGLNGTVAKNRARHALDDAFTKALDCYAKESNRAKAQRIFRAKVDVLFADLLF